MALEQEKVQLEIGHNQGRVLQEYCKIKFGLVSINVIHLNKVEDLKVQLPS